MAERQVDVEASLADSRALAQQDAAVHAKIQQESNAFQHRLTFDKDGSWWFSKDDGELLRRLDSHHGGPYLKSRVFYQLS